MSKLFIDYLIEKNYIDINGLNDPIYDGITNDDEFKKAKLKILWILKEPYDNPGYEGGGWDKREDLDSKIFVSDFGKDRATFDPMIYCSYGILNDFLLYSDPRMNYISDDEKMISVLKSIAYINVNKIPANTNSSNREEFLSITYEKCKHVLFAQIAFINPDIIIGGNTIRYFWNDLGVDKSEVKRNEYIEYIQIGDKIILDTYHPAQRSVSREDYCDRLISTIKDLKEKSL